MRYESVYNLSEVLRCTQLCQFYQKRECDRGAACAYAHSVTELRPRPDLSKTVFCFRTGGCKAGPRCKFAHSFQELKPLFVPTDTRRGRAPGSPASTRASGDGEEVLARKLKCLDEVFAGLVPTMSVKNTFLEMVGPVEFSPMERCRSLSCLEVRR